MAASIPPAVTKEAVPGSLSGQERLVVHVGGSRDQASAVGVGAGDQQRRNPGDVGRQAGGDEFRDEHGRGLQNLAPHVAAFLGRSQLILEMHACAAGRDQRLHQLESV